MEVETATPEETWPQLKLEQLSVAQFAYARGRRISPATGAAIAITGAALIINAAAVQFSLC